MTSMPMWKDRRNLAKKEKQNLPSDNTHTKAQAEPIGQANVNVTEEPKAQRQSFETEDIPSNTRFSNDRDKNKTFVTNNPFHMPKLPASYHRSKLIMRLAKFAFAGVILMIVGIFVAIPLLAYDLPSPDQVVRREGFSSKILDRNGKSLYDIFEQGRRIPIKIEDVSEDLKQATVAIEDKNFYQHNGFDILGTIRGLSRQFTRGRAQGGSTLTQQLVKNTLLTPERSPLRKLREFVLAIQIERTYTKDQILQMYLNEAPYGGTSYGIAAAADSYFGKSPKDLTLAESAILAGLPQRPSYYSPFTGEDKAYVGRTEDVLRRMREDGYITEEEEKAANEEVKTKIFRDKSTQFKAPHFVQYVQRKLEEEYGEQVIEQGGLKVTTTLDLDLQDKAQQIVAEEINKVKGIKISNGASVVLNPETGEILAMVGSRGFDDPEIDGQVNITTALRQPGSSIKPVTYVTAFKKGYTPSTLLMDVATEFPGGAGQPMYKPVNYDGKYRGPVQVRYALANSLNIPAVKMLAMVGVKDMLSTAYDLGLTSLEPTKENMSRLGLSVTLGGGEVRLLELAGAYSAFMNSGYKVEPTAILKVEDANGKVLEEIKPKKKEKVLTPEQAYLIADILSDNNARSMAFGTNSALVIPGKTVMAKTGTTNDRRDNWTFGGNKYAAVGVWVGNNDNSPMGALTSGVSGAAPIWRRIVQEALKGKPNDAFDRPGGIQETGVDIISGYGAHDGFPSRTEKFVDGTQPGEDPVHVKLKVCKNDGKLATPSDIAAGNYDEKEFFVFKENDPVSTDGVNRWQEGINAWIAAQSDARYRPPTDYCGTANPVNVEFKYPTDQTSNLPNKFTVEVRPDSTATITEVSLDVDGSRVRVWNSTPYREDVDLSDGIHILRARAKDSNGKESERVITIGVNTKWATPTASPAPTSILDL